MLASQTTLAIEIAILLFSSSCSLFFFGRGKNSKASEQISSSDNNPAFQSGESRVEKLGQRTRSQDSQRLIPKNDLEKSKRELRTLVLEKELASAALTRLYEAEAAGQITREEREILGTKYRAELKSLDSKIMGIDAFVEVGDLETLRDQLLQLVNEKIDAIDRRIERTKIAASPLIKEMLEKKAEKTPYSVQSELESEKREKPPVPDISDLLTPGKSPLPTQTTISSEPSQEQSPAIAEPVVASQSAGPIPKRRDASSDGQVEELQKELLEALDRLEKLDVDT